VLFSVGLLVGAYHYAQPGGPPVEDQATYFHGSHRKSTAL